MCVSNQFLDGFLAEAIAQTHSFVNSVLKHAFDEKYHELVVVQASEAHVNVVPEITSNQLFQSTPAEQPAVKAEVKVSRASSIDQPRVQNAAMVAASPLLASFAAAAPKKIELTRSTSMSVSGSRPSISAPPVTKPEIKSEPLQELPKQEAKPEEKQSEHIVKTESIVVAMPSTNVATSSVETPLPANSESDVLLEVCRALRLLS
jgi:nucleoid-associated protein YgaU